jgi:PAS domain S-box-containing protein
MMPSSTRLARLSIISKRNDNTRREYSPLPASGRQIRIMKGSFHQLAPVRALFGGEGKQSLEQTFIRRFSQAVVLSVILLSLLTIYAARHLLIADMHDKGESIGRILSAVTLDAALTYDYATMERYVREVSDDPFVHSVRVTRADGEVLAIGGRGEAGKSHILQYPIRLGGEDFGSIDLSFSTARVERITWVIIGLSVLAILLLHVIGIYVTRLVLHRTVLSPLQRLRDSIQGVSTGRFERREEEKAPLEFAEIALAFNCMAGRLEKSFAELEDKRRNLIAERQKLTAIVTSMADGLFVTDVDGLITSFNPSAERISGYTREEALGRSCTEVFRSTLCRDACALAHDGEIMTGVETSLVTRDGRTRQVAVSSAVLYDERGERCGGVQTFRDITDEKRRHELFCRTEKLAAIGQLAAGIAHEINNPLANILGYAKLLRPEDDWPRIEGRRTVIVEQAEKCSRIVRGLLDYSRTSISKPEEVDLNLLVRHIFEIMELQLQKKEISLRAELGKLPPLTVDPRKLDQLFFNLFLNAVQAVDREGEIEIRTRAEKDTVFFTVADNGPGVPQEERCRIFDPFYTTKPVGQGTGLGLSICVGIIEELNGTIEVEKGPLGGALFSVSLPVHPSGEANR